MQLATLQMECTRLPAAAAFSAECKMHPENTRLLKVCRGIRACACACACGTSGGGCAAARCWARVRSAGNRSVSKRLGTGVFRRGSVQSEWALPNSSRVIYPKLCVRACVRSVASNIVHSSSQLRARNVSECVLFTDPYIWLHAGA